MSGRKTDMFSFCRMFNSTGNYMRQFSCDPFHYRFAYVDSKKLWSYEIFKECGLDVHIRKTAPLSRSDELVMVFCSVKNKDQVTFIKCMRELKRQMILIADEDYVKACDKIKKRCIIST